MAKTAARLCEARDALICLVESDSLRVVVQYGTFTGGRRVGDAFPLDRHTPLGRALLEERIVHVRDMAVAVRTRYPALASIHRRSGSRTVLHAPMLVGGTPVGGIVIRRTVVRPFTAKQIALLKTFADQAALAIENARLSGQLETQNRALTEALEQQTATSEILRVISSSPTELQPVLDAVAENAARVCGADDAIIQRVDGEALRRVAHFGALPTLATTELMPLSPEWAAGRAVLERRTLHIPDLLEEHERGNYPGSAEHRSRLGHRTVLFTPLLREGTAIGLIIIRRMDVKPFTDKQIALLQTFADQAVIAIENVRLFTELQERNRALTQAHAQVTEALDQQTATSEILRVISRSPTDVRPVFEAIAESSSRLCGGMFSAVFRYEGGLLHQAAHHNYPASALELARRVFPAAPSRRFFIARAILERDVVYIPDVLADHEHFAPELVREAGFRSTLAVPMLRGGDPIGAILVSHAEVDPFTEKHIALLRTFADQAVIAIENVRLFTELEARNRDLTEALEQQTATGDVLRVIAQSPTELQPVLDAVIASAVKLAGATQGHIRRYDGEFLPLVAHYNITGGQLADLRHIPVRPTPDSASGRAFLERRAIHIPDVLADPTYRGPAVQTRAEVRTVLTVPLLREAVAIGTISIFRNVVQPFTDKQIALLQTFADQSVIAIENVRLFRELQERNRELTATLEQQTATSEILGVISSSPTDLEPVFDAILASAMRLCEAHLGNLGLYDGQTYRYVTERGATPPFANGYSLDRAPHSIRTPGSGECLRSDAPSISRT